MSIPCSNADLVVRPFAPEDAHLLHAAVRGSFASLSRFFPWCHPGYGLADAQAWVAFCIDAWQRQSEFPFGIFGTARQELLGCAGLNHINSAQRSANLGYWVGEPHRQRGIAATAAARVAAFGFAQRGFVRLEIVTLPDNLASQRVAERLGATREALARNRLVHHGQPTAAVVYSLIPDDLVARPGWEPHRAT